MFVKIIFAYLCGYRTDYYNVFFIDIHFDNFYLLSLNLPRPLLKLTI